MKGLQLGFVAPPPGDSFENDIFVLFISQIALFLHVG